MKITLDGVVYDWDRTKSPMSEALAVEDVYKRRYVEWLSDLDAGSAKAMCVLAWLIWRREGRAVPFGDIIDGTVDFDIGEMMKSLLESIQADEAAAAAEEAAAREDPTPPAPGS